MSSSRLLLVVAWSVLGLLAGHQAAYAIVFRDPEILAHALADTGHHWLTLFPIFIVAALSIAAAALWTGGRGPQTRQRRLRLFVVLQLTAYGAIEIGERLAHGAGLDGLAAEFLNPAGAALLLVGLSLQLLIAIGLTLLSTVAEAVVAHLRRQIPIRARAMGTRHPRPRALHFERLLVVQAHGVRAPPLRG